MPLGSDADLDFMLADAGVPVQYAGTFAAAVFDQSDGLQPTDSGMQVQVRQTSLVIRTDTLGALDIDTPLTVWPRAPRRRANETMAAWAARAKAAAPAVNYMLRWFDSESDGEMTRLLITKVTG